LLDDLKTREKVKAALFPKDNSESHEVKFFISPMKFYLSFGTDESLAYLDCITEAADGYKELMEVDII
jgi:hypothetical protein